MFKCIVLLLELFLPFCCSRKVVLLSWYRIFCSNISLCFQENIGPWYYTWRVIRTYQLGFRDYFCIQFCFCDTDTISPFPIVNDDPVCGLKTERTVDYASTYHFRELVLYAFNVRKKYWFPTIYLISISSLFQSPWLGCLTIVHKTAIMGWMSSLAIFHNNKPLATVVWNNVALFLFRGLLPSTLNIFLVSGLATSWDFSVLIGSSSIMFFTYFRISIFTYPFIV